MPVDALQPSRTPPAAGGLRRVGRLGLVGWLIVASVCAGCSALHPLKGIPARYIPAELRGPSRSGKETIDLSRLRQTPPDEYLIDAGDVLAVYIEGVLGRREDVPPVFFPATGDIAPSLGFPIPVRDDGTISLPLVHTVPVRGLTVRQVEETIRRAYTQDQAILQQGRDRILVSLQKPRQYQILVLRQEAANNTATATAQGQLTLGNVKRGTGQVVALAAYRNDVLNALALSGGLPGLDAENAIYVLRGARRGPHCPPGFPLHGQAARRRGDIQQTAGSDDDLAFGHSPPDSAEQASAAQPAPPPYGPLGAPVEQLPPPLPGQNAYGGPVAGPPPENGMNWGAPLPEDPRGGPGYGLPPELQAYANGETQVIRIPIRLHPGETAEFEEEDVVLLNGDIIFIESRDTEIFYTGGLLGGGQHVLPRDYDVDVLAAISIAQGTAQSGGTGAGFASRIGGITALNQDITVSASDVIVLRQLANGTQVPIHVDLNKALRDPSERVLIQPGDFVILQYKPLEAVAAFIERNILAGSLIGLAASQVNSGGGGGGN